MNFDGPKIPKGVVEYFSGPPLVVVPIWSFKFEKKTKLKSIALLEKFWFFQRYAIFALYLPYL